MSSEQKQARPRIVTDFHGYFFVTLFYRCESVQIRG